MRHFFSLLVLGSALVAPAIHADTVWETSIQKGLERARIERKPVLIDLYADWCGYCKVLEKEIFPDKEVSKLFENFITVRLDGEEFPNLKRKYGIEGYPTILYLDQHTNYLTKITGFPTKEMVIETSKKVLSEPDLEISLKKKLSKNPKSTLTYFRLGSFYFQAEKFNAAKQQFENSIKFATLKELKVKEEALFNLAMIDFQLGEWKSSVESWKFFLAEFSKSKHAITAEIHYGLSLKETGEKRMATHILQEVKPRLTDPEDIDSVDEALEEIRKGI